MSDSSTREYESEDEEDIGMFNVDVVDNVSSGLETYLKEDNLSSALRMLATLSEKIFDYKKHRSNYKIYHYHICKKLELLSSWLYDAHLAELIDLLNIYEVVQCFEKPVSRLYLIFAVAKTLARLLAEYSDKKDLNLESESDNEALKDVFSNCSEYSQSFSKEFLDSLVDEIITPKTPALYLNAAPEHAEHPQLAKIPSLHDLLMDTSIMCSAIQDLVIGICLRHYLAQIAAEYVKRSPNASLPQTTLLLLLRFVLKNFIECNILWVRHHHVISVNNNPRLEPIFKSQKNLVLYNIYVLSVVCNNNMLAYKHLVLPALLREVVTCGKYYPQKCIIKAIIKYFNPKFHEATFEELFMGISQLNLEVGIHQLIIELLNQLLQNYFETSHPDYEPANAFDPTSNYLDENFTRGTQTRYIIPFKKLWSLVTSLCQKQDVPLDVSEKMEIIYSAAKYACFAHPHKTENALMILEYVYYKIICAMCDMLSPNSNYADDMYYRTGTLSCFDNAALGFLTEKAAKTLYSLLILLLDNSLEMAWAFMPQHTLIRTPILPGSTTPHPSDGKLFEYYTSLCTALKPQLKNILYIKLASTIINMHFLYNIEIYPEVLFDKFLRNINFITDEDYSQHARLNIKTSFSNSILQKMSHSSSDNNSFFYSDKISSGAPQETVGSHLHEASSPNDKNFTQGEAYLKMKTTSPAPDHTLYPKFSQLSLHSYIPLTISMLAHVTSPERGDLYKLISFIVNLTKLNETKGIVVHPQVCETLALRIIKHIEDYIFVNGINAAQEDTNNKLLEVLLKHVSSLSHLCLDSITNMNAITIRLFCEVALLCNKCKNEPYAYKCITDAISHLPPPNLPADAQNPGSGAHSLAYLIRTVSKITILCTDDYKNVAIACVMKSAKLYDKIDRCSCLVISSHLFWRDNKDFSFHDSRLIKECLCKALEIFTTIVFTDYSREILSRILQVYIYYHRKIPSIISTPTISQISRKFHHIASTYRPNFSLGSNPNSEAMNYSSPTYNTDEIHPINGLLSLAEKFISNMDTTNTNSQSDTLDDPSDLLTWKKNKDDGYSHYSMFSVNQESLGTPNITLNPPDVSSELMEEPEQPEQPVYNIGEYGLIENLTNVWDNDDKNS